MSRRETSGRKVSAEKIKELQDQAMKTQREVAEEMGVALSTYQAILYGKVVSPHFSTIKKLAEALGVDPRDIMERELVPKARSPRVTGNTQVEILEHALARYQERSERDAERWSSLQNMALLMVERTKHRELRNRYEAVARRAWEGWLDAKNIDREDADAQEAIEQLLGDSLEAVEGRESIETEA